MCVSKMGYSMAFPIGNPYFSLKYFVRSIFVSWYVKFHAQVCGIIHIWDKIMFGLCHTGIIDYIVKLLLGVWVVFQVLQPVLWVRFFSIICEVLLFLKAPANITIKFIDIGYSAVCLLL